MKKIFNYSIAVIAAVAAVSCAKELEIEQNGNVSGQENKIVFTLPASKTTLEEGKTVWVAGDNILITDGTNKETLTVPEEADGENSVEFTTTLSGKLYAIYPVEAVADPTIVDGQVSLVVPGNQDGTFASANICAAMSENYQMAMRNVTAVVSVDAAMGVDGLVLSAPGDALSGSFTVDLSGSDPVITKKSTTGVISVDAAGGGDTYYAAVIPGTYKAGFSLTALNLDGEFETKTTTAEKTLAVNELADMGGIGDDMSGLTGDGTEGDPFQINNLAELTAFAYSVNLGKHYEGTFVKVMNDIPGGLTTPAGGYTTVDLYFKGNFDGNGKTITLALDGANNGTPDYNALFGEVGDGANIHDVIVDGTVKGGSSTAGIAGCINSGAKGVTVKNCTNKATITGTTNVGGIIGYGDASEANVFVIDGCINNGDVTGTSTKVGGIIGQAGTAKTKDIKNCQNTGKVTGANNVGGIVGYSYYGKISNCTNSGAVLGSADQATCVYALVGSAFKFPDNAYTNGIGGISGWTQNESVVDCTNTGDVEGYVKIGGICGVNYWCSVTDCNNSGNIKGRGEYANNWASANGMNYGSMAGGIIGWLNGAGNITRCNNSGKITGKSGIGGIAGLAQTGPATSTPAIQNCENTGEVYAQGTVGGSSGSNASTGGIVGLVWNHATNKYMKIISCTNSADVTNTGRIAGGVVGMLYDANNSVNGFVDKCVNTGDVQALFYVGGIVGFDRSRATSGGGIVRNSENHGVITGTRSDDAGECAGGIVGANNGSSKHYIYNCYNDGDVFYKEVSHVKPYCGGIIGQCTPTAGSLIQNCYNAGYVGPFGKVDVAEGAEATLGGIVGNHGTASILSCSYSLDTACANLVGTGSKAVGDNVAAFDDGGLFENMITVKSQDCTTVLEALNAWVAGVSTYYAWEEGAVLPVFVKE